MTADRRLWEPRTWKYPRIHRVSFGFGLDMDDTAATKNSTMAVYMMQDNALIDYEDIKTNPENADFSIVGNVQVAAGSYVPKLMVTWRAWSPSAEVDVCHMMTQKIGISMLNRLDAFDKKTGNDIETILELTHETTDEQTYPLWNTVKLYEGHQILDMPGDIPGLTANQQPEGIALDKDMFFDAMAYYTNKQMLGKVTDRYRHWYINGDLAKDRKTTEKIVASTSTRVPSLCKYANPYMFCGEIFTLPQAGSREQYAKTGDVTAVEHITVNGIIRFAEYNPDFNFSRA